MKQKNYIKISWLITILWLSAFALPVNAQDAVAIAIKGVVSDEYGSPIAGALVQSENGKNSRITDLDGIYEISISDGSTYLTYSFDGYKNYVAPITIDNDIDVTLAADPHRTDEKIQLGYYTLNRNAIVGSVSTVSGEQLSKVPVANLSKTLIGQLSGLRAQESGAELSRSGASMNVRGTSNWNNSGLSFMIDGMMISNSNYEYITPKEIESVTLLKDASTLAVYGIQAPNGLLIITTKRGHSGETKLNVSVDQSFQQSMYKPDFVNSLTYAELRNQSAFNDNNSAGRFSQFSSRDVEGFRSGDREYYPNNNWYDMYIRDWTVMQRANIDVSGGSDNVKYYSSLNFMHQNYPFKIAADNPKFDSTPRNLWFNFRNNVDVRINKYLDGFMRLSGNVKRERRLYTGNQDTYSSIFYQPPTMYGPLTPAGFIDEESGEQYGGGEVVTTSTYDHPTYGRLNRQGYTIDVVTNIIAQAGLNLDMSFLTKGLSLSGTMAYQTNTVNTVETGQTYARYQRSNDYSELEFTRKGDNINGTLGYNKGTNFYWILNFLGQANYSRAFGKHTVDAMAYTFYQQRDAEGASIGAQWLPWKKQSVGVTATYGFDNKYYVKADLGYTGSDYFARDNRYKATPSIGAAWVASNEAFLSDSKWLSYLKLRASYGKVANDVGSWNDARILYSDYFTAGNGFDGQRGNPNLSAETVAKQNYGIDIGLFNELTLSVDYYRTYSDDIILTPNATIPYYQGIGLGNYARINGGEMRSHGAEISLDYIKRINKDWTVFVGGSVDITRDKILNYGEAPQNENSAYMYRQTGYSLSQGWGYLVNYGYGSGNGFFNTQEEIDNYRTADGTQISYSFGQPRLGDLIYKDLNGDGLIDESDMAPVGQKNPYTYYSFSGGFNYKRFEFSFLFQGVAGWKSQLIGGIGYEEYAGSGYFTNRHMNAWTQERYASGEKIDYPALSLSTNTSRQSSDFWVENRSYLTLRNVEIAYTLPLSASKAISSEKIRIALQGHNLFTINNMKTKNVDPQFASFTVFQPYRVYSIGVSLIF